MRTPPLLLAVTLIFWGYQSDYLFLAALLALLVESQRFTRIRWDFSIEQLNKITDTCTVSMAAAIVYFLSTDPQAVLVDTMKLIPLFTFPILAAQEFGVSETIPLRALFLYARKKRGPVIHKTIDLSYPYLIVCILAAGAANSRSEIYYPFIIAITTLGLFYQKAKRHALILWIVVICTAGVLGFYTHKGLTRLQEKITDITLEMFMGDYTNPSRRSTSLGDIGELKTSDSIVFRMIPEKNISRHYLLKEASYNFYKDGEWFAARAIFNNAERTGSGTYRIKSGDGNGKKITVISPLKNGTGLLKLPENGVELKSGTSTAITKNRLGAFLIDRGPDLFRYDVLLGNSGRTTSEPDDLDLEVPENLMETVNQIGKELKLAEKSPGEILTTIRNYFINQFRYSLTLEKTDTASPIKGFLTKSKKGHCEFFAVSSVFLLRAAGIPARYVSGYSAHERSLMEQKIIVRRKHAHAWVEAYIDGDWIFYDTTPPSWRALEKSSVFKRFIPDLFSFASYGISYIRWNLESLKKHALWLLIPLIIIITRRFIPDKNKKEKRKKTIKSKKKGAQEDKVYDFQLLEKELSILGFDRKRHETYQTFINRIKDTALPESLQDKVSAILEKHNNHRFGKRGITDSDTKALRALIKDVVHKLGPRKK